MKKITKLFSVFATLLTVFGTLVSLAPVAHAATQETKVIVHKIVMDETDFNNFTYSEDFTKYNGNKITDLTGYFGTSATEVAGVNFKVWQKVQAAATGTKTGDELGISGDTNNYKLFQDDGDKKYGSEGVNTTTNGAEFTLPEGTYIFVEDKENSPYYNSQDGKELTGMKAVPFKLELPQAKTDGTGYFNTTDALNVYPKNTEDKPEITKTFDDDTTATKGVNIGDDIDYKITTTVPKDAAYKTFAWEDTMVNGLDFKTGSLVISLAGANLTKDTDYSLVETKRGFTVKLTETGLAQLETAAKAGDVNFTLTYKATLNDSAAVDTEIPNKVKLIYGNRPSEFTEPKSTNPSNGEIIVNKTWDTGVNQTEVVFGVYEKETGVLVGTITLPVGTNSGKLTGLDDSKEYVVIEETSVPGSLPNYSNGATGTINVKNTKNPNPNPLEPEEPKVVTYGKRFIKTDDATDTNAVKKLVGAEFIVTNEDGTKFLALKDAATQTAEITAYKAAEAAYIAAVKAENPNQDDINAKKADRDAKYEAMNMQWTWVSSQSDAFTFVSSTDGHFEVKGLKAGTYKLVETKAPDGYALLTSPIEFQVGPGTWTLVSDTAIDERERVENKKVTIPQTGGIGTVVFTVVGLSTMVFAYIAMKKRQSEEA
ncbi:TPA: isopeptide-forming domain-containing fimbrial protein [Streptococcus suis]|nr:isopeptide-forming domain-containing fimbrial protein [Streptococcus suis]